MRQHSWQGYCFRQTLTVHKYRLIPVIPILWRFWTVWINWLILQGSATPGLRKV
ncbi:hypothetical protein Plhal304r1_c015g0054791 [Plasmopara halstedii]